MESSGKLSSSLRILEDAISDVGRWSWWVENFPELFQLEFQGVQLWNPPVKEGKPPSGQIAIQFINPESVNFLSFSDEVFQDWPTRLRNDALEMPGQITVLLSDSQAIKKEMKSAKKIETVFGFSCQEGRKFFRSTFQGFVRAGDMGVVVAAPELAWRNHTEKLKLEDIPERNEQWWEYWEKYWDSKDTDHPYPKDYACEVTIPADKFPFDLFASKTSPPTKLQKPTKKRL